MATKRIKNKPLQIVEIPPYYDIWNDITSEYNTNQENLLVFAFQANVNNITDDEVKNILTDAFDEAYPTNDSVQIHKIEGDENFPNADCDDDAEYPINPKLYRYFCVEMILYNSNVKFYNGN